MAGPSSHSLPLTRASVQAAHELIKPQIHLTPVLTSSTLSSIASTARRAGSAGSAENSGDGGDGDNASSPSPKIKLFFKCENYQRVGAFKVRGAFHALARLSDETAAKGVVTHSSGNHAQALALAARTRGIKAYVVMPTISPPSKIAATKGYGAEVIFSGSTSEEREEVTARVMQETGAVLVPPYDHPNILLGQGTQALELEEQVKTMVRVDPTLDVRWKVHQEGPIFVDDERKKGFTGSGLDAVIAPCGGGGMLSGIATAMIGTGIRVFGAEPSFQGADDVARGLAAGERVSSVNTLTIADGLRTPVGVIPWSIISDPAKVRGVYAVSEEEIKDATKLVIERMKLLIEPSAAVGLAVIMYNDDFRRLVAREAGPEGWNIGVILSGGNTTLEALGKIFATG